MDNSTGPNFRSFRDMGEVYRRLESEERLGQPYIVKASINGHMILLFGSRHSNEVHDPQNQAIQASWNEFVEHTNSNKVAFCEGGYWPSEPSMENAIRKYSEQGLLTWLAQRDNIPIISVEPDTTQEVEYLRQQGHGIPAIMTYYFGRQMLQWLTSDQTDYPNWTAYAANHIASYAELSPFKQENLSLERVLEMFRQVTGKDFDPEDQEMLYILSNPASSTVSAASSFFRNIALFAAIKDASEADKDVFALYGSGHAIVLEPAIRDLADNTEKQNQ